MGTPSFREGSLVSGFPIAPLQQGATERATDLQGPDEAHRVHYGL